MTDPLFKVEPLLPLWLLVILIAGVVALLLVLKFKRNARFKTLRLSAVILLTASLIGILLQPQIRQQRTDITILLTENFRKETADSLEKKFPNASMLYFGSGETYESAPKLFSVNAIPKGKINIVTGDGLSAAGRDVIDGSTFNFVSSPLPKGIVTLSVPKEVKVLKRSTVTGVYNNANDSVKLVLEGPGGKEDSTIIARSGSQPFELSLIPKEKGNFSYWLTVDGQKEIIPINVSVEKQLNVMVVQMFPTFEVGYLKNLLAKEHQLVFRYQLSKNNFRYEYINHSPVRTDRLTNEILKEFDLLIVDSDALKLLPVAEQKNIASSVREGLGVLLLLNETPKTNRAIKSILPLTFKPFAKDTASFVLNKKLTLPAWPIEVVNANEVIPIIQNKDRILAGYVYQGFGKIGFELLQETYKLTLEGDSASYKNLWSTILQKNARTVSSSFQINVKSDFPVFANEPITVEVIGASKNAPTLLHDGIEIPMTEDFVIDDLWATKVWPKNSGWHQLQIKGDSTKQSYFVSKNGEWKSLAAANSIRNTKAIASTNPVRATSTWTYEPFARWLFYFMFLIGAGLLWLAPKI